MKETAIQIGNVIVTNSSSIRSIRFTANTIGLPLTYEAHIEFNDGTCIISNFNNKADMEKVEAGYKRVFDVTNLVDVVK